MKETIGHDWHFVRLGGLDQVVLRDGRDLLALEHLDPKLWVALSCPVQGLEIDEKTLTLIDENKDGRIRVPEILQAIKWAAPHLRDPGVILAGVDYLDLAAINSETRQGATVLASARAILRGLGKHDATRIHLAEAADRVSIFVETRFNGDGIVPATAAEEEETAKVIGEIVATVGGIEDRSGKAGVDQARADAFFTACTDCISWLEHGQAPEIVTLGGGTAPAAAAVEAVRAKIDDYFTRIHLAEFDERSVAALNRSESEYLALAAKDLSISGEEVAGFPIAKVSPSRNLPLKQGLNPAWRTAMAAFYQKAVIPVLGEDREELSESDWALIKSRVSPYLTWAASKKGAVVERLGPDRIRAILASDCRAKVNALIAQDRSLEAQFNAIFSVERLIRYLRDLPVLLRNFVSFLDFYCPETKAIFQAGELYLDGRSTTLCLRVNGANPAAAASNAYLAYCDLSRPGGETMKIVAGFTQGDSDFLRVGRNGIFYDRRGRDWDATITSIQDNPISVRQAFWSPYKKVARFVEDQIAKMAAAKDKAADDMLASGVTNVAAKPAFDVAKFAGIFAAIGLAIGAIGGAITAVAAGFFSLAWWQMPLAVIGALLLISGPSMIMASLKLRQRTVGPILDANGWAINGRVRINIPFGARLTRCATRPRGSTISLDDPFIDRRKARRRRLIAFAVVVVFTLLALVRWDASRHDGTYFWEAGQESQVPAE